MKKIFKISLLLCMLSIVGCEDEQVKISTAQDKSEILKQAENRDKSSYAGLEDVFLDTKHINTDENKLTLLIFSKNNCTYCDKLKDDIAKNPALKEMLKAHFLPYYVNVSYTKTHILHFGEKEQKIPTHNLMESYVKSPMRPTPTLVFIDKSGEAIYELPGYLPQDKMLKLYEYMASGAWAGKNLQQINREINEEI
ncbi:MULTISPECIES: thioredoxin family protein [Helicobacter]|uniref:SoxW family protein n=1 Tax=Helicobacter TaxID=209 RepID=UPI00051D9B11|nr:thioredoxin family protein [Helicobacter sp. MIT 03-1616]TLD86429.1 hypothetical protein LS67_008075 [Helicobacter sp. MIT 03-1616]